MDIDGSGRRHILSGSYSRSGESMAGLFQVLRGQPDGTFKKAAALTGTDGKPLIIPADEENRIENICTRPFAVDFDGDGKLDLVVGNFAGSFYLFKGEGKGKFQPKPQQIMVGEKGETPLKIQGNHSDPFMIDWDGDGDLDLLSGSSQGGVQWAENIAGPGKPPQFKPFRWLIKPAATSDDGQVLREEDLTGPAHGTRIWVEDINGDGKLDLLVGDDVTLVSPAEKVSEAEFKKKYAQWKDSMSKVRKQLSSGGDDEKARNEAAERLQKLYTERETFMKEDMTGFVWLYLQK